jgi:hypothetical protein
LQSLYILTEQIGRLDNMSWDAPYPEWPLPKPRDPLYQLFTQDADTFGGNAVQQNNALANFITPQPTYDIGRAPDDGIITDSFDLANLFKSGAEPAPTVPDFNVRPPIVEPIVERDPFNPNSGIITEEPAFLAALLNSGSEQPTVPNIIPRAPGNQFVQEAAQEGKPITTAAAQQPKTNYIDALSKQILGQGHTDKWTGAGFGSAEANARDMARILDSIGITDIKQFGLIDKPYDAQVNPDGRGGFVDMQGKPVDPNKVKAEQISGESGTDTIYTAPTTTKVYGNKVTGQEVPMTYSERQTGNAWGGTFEGAGNTGYRVQFDEQGNPYFYTTGASSNNMAQFAPLLAMASFIPGVAPFAQGLNALMAAKSGNVLGAIGGFAGLGGLSDVANAANFANAAQHKDILGMLGSGSGLTGVGDIGGINIKDITQGISAAKALQSGDPLAILRAASGYMGGTGEGPDPKDFIEGYFQPGGEGYIDPDKEEQTVNQNPEASSELIRMLNPYLSGEQPGERRLPAEQPSSITEEEITPNTLPFDITNVVPTLPTTEEETEETTTQSTNILPTVPNEDLNEEDVVQQLKNVGLEEEEPPATEEDVQDYINRHILEQQSEEEESEEETEEEKPEEQPEEKEEKETKEEEPEEEPQEEEKEPEEPEEEESEEEPKEEEPEEEEPEEEPEEEEPEEEPEEEEEEEEEPEEEEEEPEEEEEQEEEEPVSKTSFKTTVPKKMAANKAAAAKSATAKLASQKTAAEQLQAEQNAQNNARLLALLGLMDSNNSVANIKSYKELFDTDVYKPGMTQEEVQKEAQKEAQNDENISDNEEDFFNGGHVNDITVDDLLQILRS